MVGLLVLGLGILYLVFIGEPEKGVQRHHWWPYVGWAIFAFAAITVILAGGYGALELRVQSETTKRLITPDRHLSEDQKERLKTLLKTFKDSYGRELAVAAVDNPEANQYAVELMTAFKEGGVPVHSESTAMLIPAPVRALSTEVRGVSFQVHEIVAPPDEVRNLISTFAKVGIKVDIWADSMLGPRDYVLTIGLK
jgi:hypothetical protein